ncbi:MAG: hypothetical protein ACXV3F_07745 [Frankiaceae bacterium]
MPLVVMFVALWRAGWRPIKDEATIAQRSWDVIAGHGPLVGQFTEASRLASHPVFDPGPSLYWLLTVPTHGSPYTGPLFAVTLLAIVSVFAACLAAASVGGRWAALCVGLGAVLLEWSLTAQLSESIWNPYLALAPFGAMLVTAWAVGAGRLRWWPCLILFGSFSGQAHLMFLPGSVALIVLAPAVGMVIRRRRSQRVGWRWAAVGAAAAVACWAPAIWQQLTHSPGNLTLLWRTATSAAGPKVGLSGGLRTLSRAVEPIPVWMRAPHPASLWETSGRAAVWATTALVVLAGIVVLAWRHRKPEVMSAALVALIADISIVWVIASISTNSVVLFLTILYIQFAIWPVGAMTWFAIGYAATAWAGVRARSTWSFLRIRKTPRYALAGSAVLLVTMATVVGSYQYVQAPGMANLNQSGERWVLSRQAATIAALVGRPSPVDGPRIALRVPDPGGFDQAALMATYSYILRVNGWIPARFGGWRDYLDPVFWARPADPVLMITSAPAPPGSRILGTVDYTGTQRPMPATVWLARGTG